LTVTVKLQGAAEVLPLASVAVQLTVVTPLLKVEPELTVPVVAPEALQLKVKPGQLSAAVTVKGTAAVQTPGSVFCTIGAGQLVVGFSVSLTVTENVQLAVWLDVSVAVQVTVVDPLGNAVPEAGEQPTVTPGQLSVADGAV
jgi:hypothetical protein